MATIKFKDGSDYLLQLETLSALTKRDLLGNVIYDGAKVAADIVKEEIQKLPVDNRYGSEDTMLEGPNAYQKEGLIRSFGISPMRTDKDFTNVKLGFDGYNGLESARWPKGQPNQMVARSVERGTSWMKANPFMKRAIRKVRKQAQEAMAARLQKEITRIMNKE